MATHPRIALYGIGFIGKGMAKLADEMGWPIVAAYNRAGDKVGQDLGRVAGLDKDLGVIVQDCEQADYRRLQADIAVVAIRSPVPGGGCFEAYERFLGNGINVLAMDSYQYNPSWHDPEQAAKVDALAKQHGVTFTGTGLWDMTRIWPGLIAAGSCIRIDSMEYVTATEPLRQGVHWAQPLGIGMTVEEYDAKIGRVAKLSAVYESLGVIALQYCGFTVSGVTMTQEPVLEEEPVYCKQLDKTFAPGTCLGTRTVIETSSKEGVSVRSVIDLRVLKPGDAEHGTWKVNGMPGMQVQVVREETSLASAAGAINRIPDVIAAKPGIVTIMELGPMKPVKKGLMS